MLPLHYARRQLIPPRFAFSDTSPAVSANHPELSSFCLRRGLLVSKRLEQRAINLPWIVKD
jgi:hypothetical protein